MSSAREYAQDMDNEGMWDCWYDRGSRENEVWSREVGTLSKIA